MFDAVARLRDRFAMAVRTPTRTSESVAVTEDKIAVFTSGWVQNELQRPILRHGFDDMAQMIFYLSFGHADDFGDASR
jgi:hypothetical protein